MRSIIGWTLGIIGAILVIGVVIGGACTSGFGAFDDDNGKTASVDSEKCPNGNLIANDCQPAKGINCAQTPNNPLCKSGSGAKAADQTLKGSGTMPKFVADVSHDGWKIQGTDRLDQNPVVKGWLGRLKNPAPALWKTFPNIPNPDVKEFRVVGTQVPDGMEYGTYSSPFCFAHPCDLQVGAWEYRYISGDYSFLGTECKGDKAKGCMLVLVNVMDQSYTWRNQDVDNGFTLRGRYFNGDALEWGVWGIISHGSANMLNMPTLAHPGEVLNAGDPGNSGANCGNPLGCGSVDVTIVVQAGEAIIAVAKTTVTR